MPWIKYDMASLLSEKTSESATPHLVLRDAQGVDAACAAARLRLPPGALRVALVAAGQECVSRPVLADEKSHHKREELHAELGVLSLELLHVYAAVEGAPEKPVDVSVNLAMRQKKHTIFTPRISEEPG